MKKYFVFLFVLMLTISGCASEGSDATPTATVEQMDPGVQFLVEIQKAEATGKAIEATQMWIWGQLTATALVKEEAGTKEAAAVTQKAYAMQSTATHEVFVVQQAQTERAWNTTVTAAVAATATAYPITMTAQSIHETQTQQAWQTTATMDAAYGAAQATAAMGNAQSVELSVQRDMATNMTRAWLPWMGFIVALGLITVMGIRWSKVRVIQKDAFGATPALVMDGTVMDVDSSTSMRLLNDGSVEWKQGSEEMTNNKQKIDLVRALPAGKPDVPPFLMEGERKTPTIEVIEDGKTSRSMLDEIEDQIIEEDE